MHPVLDFAAVGGVFLIALLAPAGIADASLLTNLEKAPLLVLAGGVGVGGFISLLTPAVLETILLALPFISRNRSASTDADYVNRTYEILSANNGTLIDWLASVRQQAQATINGGIAMLLGAALAPVVFPGLNQQATAVVVVVMVLGALCVLSGARRQLDARRIERRALGLDRSGPASSEVVPPSDGRR